MNSDSSIREITAQEDTAQEDRNPSNDGMWNPSSIDKESGIRLSRIQNPRLSWIYLHFGDRLLVDSRPTVHRQTTNSRPTDYNELWFVPHFFRLNNIKSSF